jgi:hypothetical protein
MPVPPEAALYWDYANGNLYGSQPGQGQWILIGPIASGSWDTLGSAAAAQVAAEAASLANSLMTHAGDVLYENATPTAARLPIGSTGQVLTVVAGLPAWAAAGGKAQQTARVHIGVIASATPSTPVTALTWAVPFADNNYTVVGSVTVAETPSDGAATAICCIGMIQLQAGGAGINFVVCNADGVSHDVTAQFIAIHD